MTIISHINLIIDKINEGNFSPSEQKKMRSSITAVHQSFWHSDFALN